MYLGILVTIVSGFGKKGYYHSQEIGLGKALSKMGHDVCIYKCVPENGEKEETILTDNMKIKYIPVRKIGVHGNIPISNIDPKLDGLLCFADTQLFLPHVIKYCIRNNIVFVPYIGIAHSFQQTTKSKIMDFLFSIGTLQYYKKMPVLAKTLAAKEELAKLGVSNCKVAPVGLDPAELKKDFKNSNRAELRDKYGYCEDDILISFVARLKPEKRPLDLITIFDHIKDGKKYKLLMIGEGPQRAALDKKIASLDLKDEIKIIDRVPYKDMWEIYRISDYFVNLRAEEIFGMAVMEAVYYETSVAAINAPGPSTILKGMMGHKICNNDREVEKWLLATYPSGKDLTMSSNRIINDFTWDSCASKYIDLVRKGII